MSPKARQRIVTIDGPSGVGKSTLSRRLAAVLNYTYLDTGAMYRAVGLKLKEGAVDLGDESALRACLKETSLELMAPVNGGDDVGVILDGRDVSLIIRSQELAMMASTVSALPAVREKLTLMQQEIGKGEEIVAEGRDTGTVVFPNAAWKFYLDASPLARTQRRAKQLRAQGEEVEEEELLSLIIRRDLADKNRSIAPLIQAEDAHVIDTGSLSIDGVTKAMLAFIDS